MATPYCLCFPAQSMQMKTPREDEAHLGFFLSQSTHFWEIFEKKIRNFYFLMYVIFRNLPQTSENRIAFGVIDNRLLELLKSLWKNRDYFQTQYLLLPFSKDIC